MQLRWDIFCRVVDNWGDIGVCWRLAAELAARGEQVRLWTDDASALAWMAPDGHAGVQVLPWPDAAPADGLGDVLLETFGCELPPAIVAACAQAVRPPLWINLEYLSAERYVERSHRLPSPIQSGAGRGLTRWYFYPGFTERTGGLLREHDLAARQAAFDRSAWRARHGIAPEALAIALFCYEPPALPTWLDALAQRGAVHLLVTPGRAAAAVQAWEQKNINQIAVERFPDKRNKLQITYLSPCTQTEFDHLLLASDFNCVRGEDSLVRALWAGAPLLWQIYPQHDDAHHAKLDAFLGWLQAPTGLRQLHLAWNALPQAGAPLVPDTAELRAWGACVQAARTRLLAQDDLVTQLLGFVSASHGPLAQCSRPQTRQPGCNP